MAFEAFEDFFDFRFGPFHMSGFSRPFQVRYERTSESHVVQLKLRPDIKKEDIKVRLQEGGVLEIAWPRRVSGEDISVE
jgi:HSP20 family molecular chaperone IbpA